MRAGPAALAVALGASVAAASACSSPARTPAPIANTPSEPPRAPTPDAARLVDGALWACQVDDHAPQPCRLKRIGDTWTLTKLLGSLRFRGRFLLGEDDTARFVGNLFCPREDCGAYIEVELHRAGAAYQGALAGATLSVRYDRALATEWGGAGYGRLTGDE